MPRDTRTYITLHDGMPTNKKIRPLSDKAFRTLIEIWCWCSTERSDGVIDEANFGLFGSKRARDELVKAGLIDTRGKLFQAHDYLEHQRSKAEIEALSAARARAGAAGGKAKANAIASANQADGKTEAESESTSDTEDQDSQTSSHVGNREAESTDEGVIQARRAVLSGLGIKDFGKVKAAIVAATSRPVSDEQAQGVIGGLLAKATGPVRYPQAYVLRSITESWAEIQQAIDEEEEAS